MLPIWKDTYANVLSSFSIMSGGKLIMSGISIPKPGEINARVNVSRLVEDNVFHSAPSFNTGVTVTHDDAVKVFTVNGTSYEFIWDWSFITREFNTNTVFNYPIKNKYGHNQLTFSTNLVNGQLKTTTQSVGNECGEYALYYLNRYGGWDSFLFEGRCKRKDEISALTLTQEYDNNNTTAFGLTNYYNTVTPKWELNTGWLSNIQSESFAFNVIPSPMITNNEAEYKQKTRQERHINYILNVTASQNQHINI